MSLAGDIRQNLIAHKGTTAMQSKQRFYRPELDVLRFIAFFLVLLNHSLTPTGPISDAIAYAGAFGVCLFFLLSSYLITELMELEVQATGSVRLGAFYVRRILRIWPLYLAVLLLDFTILHFTHPGLFTGSRLAAFLLLAGNWYVVLHGFTYTISTPLWSISVEEQFYVLWPSVRKYLKREGLLILSTLMFVIAYFTLYILCKRSADVETGVWVNSLVQFQFFSVGALLALGLKQRVPTLSAFSRLILFVCGLGLLFVAQYVFHIKNGATPPSFSMIGPGYLCVGAGCSAVFLSVLGAQQLGRARPLVYLGKISYGLYVYHWMVLRGCKQFADKLWLHTRWPPNTEAAIVILITLAGSVILASFSYHFAEAPIFRFKKRFEVIRTRPV
jgi:peptidoglycan/LPS O-acetylase OafA/YrhL